MDAQINARDPHQHAEEKGGPAHAFLPDEEHGRTGSEGGRGMAGGKALVAFGVHADQLPEAVINAALVNVGPCPRDEHLEAAVRHQRAEKKPQAHRRAEAPRGLVERQQQGQKDQKSAALAENGDEFEKGREKAAADAPISLVSS